MCKPRRRNRSADSYPERLTHWEGIGTGIISGKRSTIDRVGLLFLGLRKSLQATPQCRDLLCPIWSPRPIRGWLLGYVKKVVTPLVGLAVIWDGILFWDGPPRRSHEARSNTRSANGLLSRRDYIGLACMDCTKMPVRSIPRCL